MIDGTVLPKGKMVLFFVKFRFTKVNMYDIMGK